MKLLFKFHDHKLYKFKNLIHDDERSNVSLTCHVSGNHSQSHRIKPTPLYTKNIGSQGTLTITDDSDSGSLPQRAAIDKSNDLTILLANFTHGGTYTCSASYSLSSIHTDIIAYVKYPETCQTCSVLKANINNESGVYVIDPDDENPCDMSGQGVIGVTVVNHSSEIRTHVTAVEDDDKYEQDIHDIATVSLSWRD